jgi:hypothetical protein
MVETRTAPERAVEAQQLLAAIDRKIQATSGFSSTCAPWSF